MRHNGPRPKTRTQPVSKGYIGFDVGESRGFVRDDGMVVRHDVGLRVIQKDKIVVVVGAGPKRWQSESNSRYGAHASYSQQEAV